MSQSFVVFRRKGTTELSIVSDFSSLEPIPEGPFSTKGLLSLATTTVSRKEGTICACTTYFHITSWALVLPVRTPFFTCVLPTSHPHIVQEVEGDVTVSDVVGVVPEQ